MTRDKLFLPWRVTQNWHGKIAIVDNRNDGVNTTSGRVCNMPQDHGRGLIVAHAICDIMNAHGLLWKEEV